MPDPSLAAQLAGIITSLLLLAIVVLAVSERAGLPYTVMLVVVGVVAALLANNGFDLLLPLLEHRITDDVILTVLLPTLVFETAYNLDSARLKNNLAAIFTLAVPGILLSSLLIGLLVWALTPLDGGTALLLGVILSATDPVAVIALFRKLGAPKELEILVEGESLFNDATTIALTKALLAFLVAGVFSFDTIAAGAGIFIGTLVGGALCGWVLGKLTSLVIGHMQDEPFLETALTIVLAYGSYLVAEQILEVSGIVATVIAGLTLGQYGKARISSRVKQHIDQFWAFMAFVSNSLIFLFVGLRFEHEMVLGVLGPLAVVVAAMLISRAAMIYLLLPLAGRLGPSRTPAPGAYRHVVFWGGLRGAITLALAMGVADVDPTGQLLPLAMGAVLFTLLIQGMTMGRLVRRLGLDRPDLAAQVTRIEGWQLARRHALEQLRLLEGTGLDATGAPEEARRDMAQKVAAGKRELQQLRRTKMDPVTEWRLLLGRCLSFELRFLYELHDRGLLPKRAFIELRRSLYQQQDALRHDYPLPEFILHQPHVTRVVSALRRIGHRLLGRLRGGDPSPLLYVAWDFEEAWGRMLGCEHTLANLEEISRIDQVPPVVAEEVRKIFQGWLDAAGRKLELIEQEFPEVARERRRRLVERMVVTAQRSDIERQVRFGMLPEGIAENMLRELAGEILNMEWEDVSKLQGRAGEILHRGHRLQKMRWLRRR